MNKLFCGLFLLCKILLCKLYQSKKETTANHQLEQHRGLELWCLTPLSKIFISFILWWSVLLLGETGVLGENHCPGASH
jgi:hypothetical protein